MKKTMRKREVKKRIAFLLALSMVLSFSNGIIAGASYSNIGNESHDVNENIQPENGYDNILTENQFAVQEYAHEQAEANDTIARSTANSFDTGRIDVSIGNALFLDCDTDFTITLTNAQGYFQEQVISLSDNSEKKAAFCDLADGEYTVSVTSPGFADYSQNITVSQKGYLVKLTVGFCEGYSYTSGGLHPGVILIGDTNGDGNIDDQDKNILVDAIDFRAVPEEYVTDLNKDGQTDLLDLKLFSKSYGENKDTAAAVEEFIPANAIQASASEGTAVDGDMEKMLNGEETVVLTPSDNGEISASNPVSVEFDLLKDGNASVADGIVFETGSDNPVAEALVGIRYIENGTEYEVTVPVTSGVNYLLKESDVYAELDENGCIQVHLGNQAAIKKVTLTLTAMQNSNNLAEISKVEFVNGMESRIPEPEIDIPVNLSAEAGSECFVLEWDPCANVTGYEVKIEQGELSETVVATSNSITFTSFCGKEIKNYTTYKVSVQSVNGTWRSGYCDSAEVTPIPSGPPDKPDKDPAF